VNEHSDCKSESAEETLSGKHHGFKKKEVNTRSPSLLQMSYSRGWDSVLVERVQSYMWWQWRDWVFM